MKKFTYVVYGTIPVVLNSVLHIGGDDEEKYSLAVNGKGEYIIPATGTAGVVRHYLEQVKPDLLYLLGDKKDTDESRVYYYDAVCHDIHIEQRTSTRLDHESGTAYDKSLHTISYIGSGMKAELRIQVFADDESERNNAEVIVQSVASGIESGDITFGGHTATGAGVFELEKGKEGIPLARVLTLDLRKKSDLGRYLEGIDSCFEETAQNGEVINSEKKMSANHDVFELTGYFPEGILVKSGIESDVADQENISRSDFRNLKTKRYFIPGTSVKGIMRSYAELIWSSFENNDTSGIDWIFGNSTDEATGNIAKSKSHVSFSDTDIFCIDYDEHQEGHQKVHNRIKVDRWLGGVITGGKMNEEIIGVPEDAPVTIRVSVDKNYKIKNEGENNSENKVKYDEKIQQAAKAIVFLALRDIGTGRVTIGSGNSIGLGHCTGTELKVNGETFKFENGSIAANGKNEHPIEWLKTLEEWVSSIKKEGGNDEA